MRIVKYPTPLVTRIARYQEMSYLLLLFLSCRFGIPFVDGRDCIVDISFLPLR